MITIKPETTGTFLRKPWQKLITVGRAYDQDRFEASRSSISGYRHEAAWLRFTDWLDRSCTLYAERIVPARHDRPLPAILHAVGGGQKVETADLLYWAVQGYACASFDWQIGELPGRDPERTSQWPDPVVAQHAPNPALENCLLPLAIEAAQVTLSWLLDDACVDPARVGMSGISWGGYLTWATAAYDKRIQAICPVYGCGIFGKNQAKRPHSPEVIDYWRQHWDPQALASKQTAPAAYNSGTNDFFGDVHEANRLLTKLPVDHRWSLLPNADHSISPGESALASAWMAHHLKNGPALPRTPVLDADGRIQADPMEAIAEPATWWTNSTVPAMHACWNRGIPDTSAHTAFARVRYTSGLSLCSALRSGVPSAVTGEQPSIWPDLAQGIGWRWELGSTQFHGNRVTLEPIDQGQRIRITPSSKPSNHPVAFYLRQIQDQRRPLKANTRLRFQWRQPTPPEVITAHLIHTHPDFDSEFPLPCQQVEPEGTYEIRLPAGLKWTDICSLRLKSKGSRQSFLFGPLQSISP